MADEWIGVIHSTRPMYMKGASDLTVRSRLLLALAKQKGRIELNAGGDECKWQVEFSQPEVSSYADGGQLDFSNHDAFRQLSVDWRGYVATDTLTKKQRNMNTGEEALIKLFETKNNRLMKSIRDKFCGELYRDGSEAGRENAIHGLETFLGDGTTVVADVIAEPDDTYGLTGLATDLGDQGGSWSSSLTTSPNAAVATDWPYGNGDSEYDYLSPKLVNYGSTSWQGSSNTWISNGWYAIGAAITWLTTGNGQEGAPDICVLAPDLFQGYKDSQESLRRIVVPHKGAQDLGFGANVLNQDGVAIQSDFDCPVATGYMLNLDTMTIRSIMPELFWGEGPDPDPRSGWSYLWGCGFYGNVCWSPKHVAKLHPFATQ
jgi:hypothetical protein